jgi:oligopeptide/dipeptide ABC transporter ATP-binding protein|tara:strand:+ start:3547 stop:4539 length:993 start_codon:yes stop_codon:yes gene_type:complete
MSQLPLLQVKGLCVDFSTRNGNVQVLDHLDLHLAPGETLGIVGESGCGKSMTALSIMQLIPVPPGNISGGQILLNDTDLLQLSESRMQDIRGNDISMIFQEPMTSLNPVFTIGTQVSENIRRHQSATRLEARDKTIQILEAVGIPAPEVRIKQYPHELSGGMRQRIMIAMAISCQPKVLIADEPTTALDVTIQAQIFDLLRQIQKEMETSIILITHDMSVIAEFANRVVVMYAGSKVEEGMVRDIIDSPRHPYTKGLINCIPFLKKDPGTEREELNEIPGVVPDMSQLGIGCSFAPRCNYVMDKCYQEKPPEVRLNDNHYTYCWYVEEAK